MPPRNRKAVQSADDLLGAFGESVATAARAANIYRLKPLPQQELFLQSLAKIRIAMGGNRAGKTHINMADDCLVLTRRHPYRQQLYPEGPLRMRWIGVDFERGIKQIAIPKMIELLPPSFLINGNWSDSFRDSEMMLTLADKSTVSFMSYEQQANKFQGVSLHHTSFDEEPPKAIWDEDMLRHVDVAGTVSLSETPVLQLEWVQDELIEPFESGARGDVTVIYLDTRDNINLPVEELQKLSTSLSADEQVSRLAGQYKTGSRVFPEFQRKYPFVIPSEAFRLTPAHVVYESMDHGYVNPTSWNWTAVAVDGSITVFKNLYAPGLVVAEWAKAVKQMRIEICAQYGIPLPMFTDMLRGTFGDPAIADSGNSAAQTGITIQMAYALEGVNIATTGIRQARAGNQNIGLDMFHTYLRMRPDIPTQPWLQVTDDCPSLIAEIALARKPKQSSQQALIKNASEQIRDKDNHGIDAQKYLWIVTHDLRPARFQTGVDDHMNEMGQLLHAVPTQFETHAEVLSATLSSHNTYWTVHESDSYQSLEE